ncbi:AraC family transcriptional regulator [Devosia oryziradicis]|uniref:AraC family transcriptional regulator n=1 Tax=Devosia oryziradicis TaxID=2801335 RepID=A0ABX7BZY1_9HYPH|nr:AraC family transcriptional regulator [Devosia oryziradicis]QQR37082.1 AraC family transcriptional regulator [Devosia oryziradicis]
MLDLPSSDPTPPLAMDALSEVLQDFRLTGVNYGRCELRAPWCLDFAEQKLLRFHFVSEGTCWLHTEANGWQRLHEGDLVLLPQGIAHELADCPNTPAGTLKRCQITGFGGNVCSVVQPGEGAVTTLFSGSMELGSLALHPLLEAMPEILQGCDVASRDPLVKPLLDTMTAEAAQPRMGSATILSRMADLVTARLIRCWADSTTSSTTGWLAAIRDPSIGRALAAIHREPGGNWTLERLASVAGQSRSVFAERFSALMHEGPAHYLGRWRMQLAHAWLAGDGLAVADVAFRLGYESEASFSRAFKRIVGKPPGLVRREGSGRKDMSFGF